MASSGENVIINGFAAVPVKFNKKCTSGHYLYVKEHSVRDTDPCKPKDRTLFVLNVPPYVTEECLERLFSDCGKVETVYLHAKPTSAAPAQNDSQFFNTTPPVNGFKVAYVVFKKSSAVEKAKRLSFNQARVLSTVEHPLNVGVKRWCQEYAAKQTNVEELQTEIDKYMSEYDNKLEELQQQEKEDEGQADEDGWVKVTRHGKNKGVPRTEAVEKRVTAKEKKKKSEQELLNFYAFQVRESKREHIAQLRQNFEEDKQKISLMRAARKFRPY